MAKKEKQPPAQGDLAGIEGKGVAPVTIPDVDKAIGRYERAKEKRCAESPKEVGAKRELRECLHANREALPVNKDGQRF